MSTAGSSRGGSSRGDAARGDSSLGGSSLRAILETRRIVVCCGAGGVGKTTTASGLALAAARAGRRVLALTIDPSRRLAEVLGVPLTPHAGSNVPSPVPLDEGRRLRAGLGAGQLDVWMLDARRVVDDAIRRLVPEHAETLMQNRIYQRASGMVTGMQEYAAMEALYAFVEADAYDLIVLDTAPSRHALDFLEGPTRLAQFLDGRIAQLFFPRATTDEGAGPLRRGAARIMGRVLGAAFGPDTYAELQALLESFAGLFVRVQKNAEATRARLASPSESAFLLVTSPSVESVADALYFRERTTQLGLPFAGFVLSRSRARTSGKTWPSARDIGRPLSAAEEAALRKLTRLAVLEDAEVRRHRRVLEDLAGHAGPGAFAVAAPFLSQGDFGIESLVTLAEAFGSA